MANDNLTNPVPLSNDSVFVPATSPNSIREDGVDTIDSAYTLRSHRTRSDSAVTTVDTQPGRSSINLNSNTPRRSRAHQLSLLGLHTDGTRILEDGEGASEEVLLTGLSNRSTPTTKSTSKFHKQQDESQFDIGPSSDDDELEDVRMSGLSQDQSRPNGNHHYDRQYDNSSTYDDLDLEAAEHNPFDDEEDEYDGHLGREIKLPFESTTKRERIWMWASTAIVIALSIVSIAIAVDWIDWPGDGIGKN